MKPTIGRIVHFKATNRDANPYPAMILSINGEYIDLDVFKPGTVEYVRKATMAADAASAQAGQCYWPERVEA